MSIRVKICGLKTPEAIQAAIQHGADFLGFVFYPASPRHVTHEAAKELGALVPSGVAKVAVTVDATDEALDAIMASLKPSYIQLHGNEDAARIREIKSRYKVKTIKAFRIRNADDVAQSSRFLGVADMLLFDARAPEAGALPGGTGLAFDWALLKGRKFPLPWFLSGGLGSHNVAEAIRATGARMIDASSSVEHAPGEKDPKLIQAFIEAIKREDRSL